MKSGIDIQFTQTRVNLRPYAMHQNQTNPEAVEQCKVMNMVGKARIQNGFSTE